MQMIPEALARYRQFILFDADKRPVNPYTGQHCALTDPAVRSDAATAMEAATRYNLGVGFVFTEDDPFFFYDLDSALQPDGQWSPLAVQMCQIFAGCYVEVSRSGTGLHIFGTGKAPEHACKNTPLKLELYHTDRYCALTGTGASGTPDMHVQPQLEWLVANYFPPRAGGESAEWTTNPVAEWSGPADDDELITRMLAARGSVAGMFGARATLRDLWEANADQLNRHYPAQKDGQDFDHSSADAALCQHLAFWTGKDCDRIDRLFRRSGLYREKWERDDYRQSTVLHAVNHVSAVYGTRTADASPGQPPAPVSPQAVMTDHATLREGLQYLAITQQQQHFAGCVYVRDLHRIFTPDGALLKPDPFRATYGGYIFAVDLVNDKTTRSAWEAFTESNAFHFPKAHEICFRPECPPGSLIQEEGRVLVNTYIPIQTPQQAGNPQPVIDHVAKLLPAQRDRDILWAYMAALVQYPGVKFQWTPLLQGMEGNGKTLLTRCLSYAVGARYTHIKNPKDIGNVFNAWVIGKIFVGIEEIYVADRQEVIDALKPLITNDRVEIQGKGGDQTTGDNRANFFMCSNHRDAIRKTQGDRRYAVFFTAQQEAGDLERDGMCGNYFPSMYEWLRNGGYAIVNQYLRQYAIPDELNPATMCQRAPETSTTAEAIRASMGGIEQEVLEAVEEGRPGFAGGWISSTAFDRLLEDKRAATRIPPNRRRDILRSLGFDWHPALRDGRVTNNIADPAGPGKPRLYIRTGHLALNLGTTAEVVRCYLDAQAGTTPAAHAFAAASGGGA